MHSTEIINQFLNLRAQGWSFARIADLLHVSKPTLLDWGHKYRSQLETLKESQERSIQTAALTSQKESPLPVRRGEGQGEGSVLKLEHLTLLHSALRQELIKRTLQSLSDQEIETLANDIQHQIEKIDGKEIGKEKMSLI